MRSEVKYIIFEGETKLNEIIEQASEFSIECDKWIIALKCSDRKTIQRALN